MAKKKVVKRQAMYGSSRTKAGKRVHMGTRVTYSDGSSQTLLTPAGKGAKYSMELLAGCRFTNEGEFKKGTESPVSILTDTQAAWRSGYLQARKDCAAAYKAKKITAPKNRNG